MNVAANRVRAFRVVRSRIERHQSIIQLDSGVAMDKCMAYFKDLSPALDHGNMDILVGEYYLQRMEWGMARMMLENGIRRGKLNDSQYAEKLLERTLAAMY